MIVKRIVKTSIEIEGSDFNVNHDDTFVNFVLNPESDFPVKYCIKLSDIPKFNELFTKFYEEYNKESAVVETVQNIEVP